MQYRRSIALVIFAGLLLSTSGIAVRSLQEASGMQIVFYRAMGLVALMSIVLLLHHRGAAIDTLKQAGRLELMAGLLFAGASLAIIFALLNTTVANVMFIVSLAPFFAALGGWLFLHERVPRTTRIAMCVAILGVFIMVEGGVSSSGMLGILYAFTMAICYGLFTVCLRAGRKHSMLPAVCLSGILLALIAGLLSDSLRLPTQDIMICLAMGSVQLGLAIVFLSLAAQHVPAAQISLLAMLEVVLNPIWVWLGVGEVPGVYTVLGGLVILSALIYLTLNSHSKVAESDSEPH